MRKGQKMPEELRKKLSERMKNSPLKYWLGKKRVGYKLSPTGRENIILGLKYRVVSAKVMEHAQLLNKNKFGKEHPKWTENKKRPFYKAIRTLYQYKNWRTSIFEKDNYTCQICNKRGGDIEADHNPIRFIDIINRNNIKTVDDAIKCNELWTASGRTLCKECHLTTYRLSRR